MIVEPADHLQAFADAGADTITVHAEACTHLHRTLQQIKELGTKAGVSLNPATPLVSLEEILEYVDLILLMTVNPGFGGQAFIESSLPRIRRLRGMLTAKGLGAELEVDGGINAETAPRIVAAGANVLVAGEAIFGAREGVAEAMRKIRESLPIVTEE